MYFINGECQEMSLLEISLHLLVEKSARTKEQTIPAPWKVIFCMKAKIKIILDQFLFTVSEFF